MLQISKKHRMFALLIILRGGETRSNACGYFYIHKPAILRFCTPVWSVNAPTASKVISNGKGRTVFNSCLKHIFSAMLNTEKPCATCAPTSALSAEQIINILNYGASVTDVRKNLRSMMDAWFLYHEPTPEEKDAVYATWYTVDKAMEAITVLNERRAAI